MIFVLLVIFVILFFICWTLISNKTLSFTLGIGFAILLMITVGFMTLNFRDHLGMRQETSVKKTMFTSVDKNMDMILYKKIGQSNNQVVIYKTDPTQKKPTVTRAIDTKNEIKTGAPENVLVTKTRNWVYKNNFDKFMYYFTGKQQFISRTNTFNVKRGCLVLSTDQAKVFGQAMKQQMAQMKASQSNPAAMEKMKSEGEAYVKSQMMDAMEKNPGMSQTEQQKLEQKYMNQFKAKMMQKAKKQMVQNALQQIKNGQ